MVVRAMSDESEAPPRLAPGTRVLDRYVVGKRLGAGGMGEVYHASHERLQMPVVVKILLRDDVPQLAERFEREAALMAQVHHPNVAQIHDFGLLASGIPCIVMEHVPGESMADLLRRTGALPYAEATELMLALLAGLEAIHRAGILHRDLKPANVVVDGGSPATLKILDFGIAKALTADLPKLTATGMIVGTPAYMPPEQIFGGKVDARTDVYSAAIVLYELLTGDVPFADDSLGSLGRRLVDAVPAPVAPAMLPPLPDALGILLLSALSPEASARPASARHFAEALRRLRSSPGSVSEPIACAALAPTEAFRSPLSVAGDVPRASSAELGHYVVAARLPPSRLARAEERRWLAGLVGPRGRGFTFAAQYWFAVTFKDPSSILTALAERFGSTARAVSEPVDRTFSLTAAQMTGASPLPAALLDLLERLG